MGDCCGGKQIETLEPRFDESGNRDEHATQKLQQGGGTFFSGVENSRSKERGRKPELGGSGWNEEAKAVPRRCWAH